MNKIVRLALVSSVFAVGVVFLAGCPPPPPGAVYVGVAPPPPQVEFVGVAPGPEFVWVRGYHRWDGSTYIWVPGSWQRPPRPHAVWRTGHWKHGRQGWYWVEGRWR